MTNLPRKDGSIERGVNSDGIERDLGSIYRLSEWGPLNLSLPSISTPVMVFLKISFSENGYS